MENLKKFLRLNVKIIILSLLTLIGIVMILCKGCCAEKEEIILSIGSGLFASSFCMLVYEIINSIREADKIIRALKRIIFDLETYYHCTVQCHACIKSFVQTQVSTQLLKNALTAESFNIKLFGNMLLSEINNFNSDFDMVLSSKLMKVLSEVAIAIKNNMSFISAAGSNSTGEFNHEFIVCTDIDSYLLDLKKHAQNRISVFYVTDIEKTLISNAK